MYQIPYLQYIIYSKYNIYLIYFTNTHTHIHTRTHIHTHPHTHTQLQSGLDKEEAAKVLDEPSMFRKQVEEEK
jgi:hypothetical protein